MSYGTPITYEPIQSTCPQCSVVTTSTPDSPSEKRRMQEYPNRRCGACLQKEDEEAKQSYELHQKQMDARHRENVWEKTAPALYRDSDPARIPSALLAAVDSYQYGPMGLGFIGETGKGKTRAMMMLLKRLIIDEGKRPKYVTMTDFSMKVASLGCEVAPFIEGMCQNAVLLLDDLGKGRLTDAVQGHLFHVIETRTANQLPILFTSNAGGDQLAAMLSEDRAFPIIRRLKEFCTIVKV